MRAASDRRRGRNGSALVWVVLLVVFLSALCLFFFETGRAASQRASADHDDISADELLASAADEILAKLEEGFAVEAGSIRDGSVAASPGLLEVLRYDVPLNRGGATGSAAFEGDEHDPRFFSRPFSASYDGEPANPRWIPMFSWKSFAPRLKHLAAGQGGASVENPDHNPYSAFNINTADQPWNPGTTWITGVPAAATAEVRTGSRDKAAELAAGASSAERPIWVQWIPLLEDPSRPASASNPMVGRYAYWVDLENTKLDAREALTPLRDDPTYPRLLGEAGRDDGGSLAFEQDGSSSARGLLADMENALPAAKSASQPVRRDGNPGPGFSAAYAADARDTCLGPGSPADRADLVDWTFFETPKRKEAESVTVGRKLAERIAAMPDRDRPLHPWFLDYDELMDGDGEAAALARQVGSALTFQGAEEDVDPLGRPRIDLAEFQSDATGHRSSTVSLAAITGSALWSRLNDGAYQGVYQPGESGASFVDSLAPFAADGAAAAQQILVNIAEAAQPDGVPPLIDSARGIVGARSMPYVIELSTRARSAYWQLPEADRNDPERLLQTTSGGSYSYTHNQKRLHYYATHAVVDLCVGLVNPNPFETEPFQGEIEFDITWGSKPSGATVETTFKAPLNGFFNVNSLPGKESKELQPLGHTVNIPLGVFPVSALNDDRYATCLRIRGWRIKRGDAVWHQVPIRHPGAKGALDWWRMAQPGTNAGSAADKSSLAAYQDGGGRSVGWFCMETLDALIPESLGVSNWTNANATDAAMKQRVAHWLELTPHTAVLERVVCLDPVLGHRTGNPMLPGLFGRGHFYGVQGHFWRRQPVIEPQPVVGIGQTEPAYENLGVTGWNIRPAAGGSSRVSYLKESGGRLVSASAGWPVPSVSSTQGAVFEGRCLTHKLIVPGTSDGSDGEDGKMPDSLTAVYRIPSVEGAAAPGRLGIPALPTTVVIDSAVKIENVDLETTNPPALEKDFVKLPDGKKGARGFYCSAPAKRIFRSPGEIGFCHSGFPLTPVQIGPDEGRTPFQLNNRFAGPPMRMLLDLLSVPTTGRPWNVNTSVAHDEYMLLRTGGDDVANLKDAVDPASMQARAVWLPAGRGFVPRKDGSDAYRGKEAKNLADKAPGRLLDRHLSPFPVLRRPWDMWLGFVGGDFSRSGDSLRWGVGNSAFDYFGPGYFTWKPGDGVDGGPWTDLGSELPGLGRVLAFGVDGRKDDKNENAGSLNGRFAADQNLGAIDGSDVRLPAHFATRFGLLPMRHFRSDLALDFHQENHESGWLRFKTALNPGVGGAASASEMTGDKDLAESVDGASFPGGHHSSGVFYQAPMALIANQAGFTADAFSAYVVVETVRDKGRRREGEPNSGPGHCDPDDTVLARRWARLLILKQRDGEDAPRFHVALSDIQGN